MTVTGNCWTMIRTATTGLVRSPPFSSVSTAASSAAAATSKSSLSSSSALGERFGSGNGSSGWKWDKNGVGMGGKDKGPATEAKPDVGKGKTYQVEEYFKYNPYSFYDIEKQMAKNRVPQPKSGLSDFWQ